MKQQQELKYKTMLDLVETNIEKCQKFFDFAETEIPKIKDASLLACA